MTEVCDFPMLLFFSLNYGAFAPLWLMDGAFGGLWCPISVRRRGVVSPSEPVIIAGGLRPERMTKAGTVKIR